MSEIILFAKDNTPWLMAVGLGLLVLAGIAVQLSLLRRVKRMQQNIESITEKVQDYLAVVMASEEEEQESGSVSERPRRTARSEAEDDKLVLSVLQEIFP